MEKHDLEAAIAEGLSCRQLAERFGFMSSGAVQYWLRKYELKTNSKRTRSLAFKFTDLQLKEAVLSSSSMAEVMACLGATRHSGGYAHYYRRFRILGLDISHFQRRVVVSIHKKTSSEILVCLPEGSNRIARNQLQRAMLEVGFVEKCYKCGSGTEWCGEKLILEIDHIDGNGLNNLPDNLRFLCPNCHSQTPTFKNKKRHALIA